MTSASTWDREHVCPPSAVMTPRAEETGEYAEVGNHIHEYLRRDGTEAALADVPEELRERCSGINTSRLWKDLTIVGKEEAYVVDAATGNITYLGSNIHREYNATMQRLYKRDMLPTEIQVTLDLEAMVGTKPCSMDYKTGLKKKPAAEMRQMKLQAYVLAVKYDADDVEVRVAYIDEYGNVDIDTAEFSRMELDGVPSELRDLQSRIEKARSDPSPTVYPGEHCQYCPCLRTCSAQTAMVKAFIDGGENTTMITLAQAGVAYGRMKQVEKQLENVKKTLAAIITQNGSVPADEGYEYRVTESSRPYMPADLVRGKIIQLGGTEEDLASISKKSKFPVIKRMRVKKP